MNIAAIARRIARFVPCALVAAAGLGCARQGELYDDRDWTKAEEEAGAWREVESLFSAEESDPDHYDYALKGVRHDLTMAPNAQIDARCTCLDVAVGTPADGSFRWQGTAPAVSPDDTVFAMRTEGSQCADGPAEKLRRPSIQAVEKKDPHVIVVVEELPLDRPQALGAIIPMPRPGGSLYVRAHRPKGRDVPYARGEKVDAGMCRVLTRERVTQPLRR